MRNARFIFPFRRHPSGPGSFLRDDLGDLTILLGHPRDPQQLIHPFL